MEVSVEYIEDYYENIEKMYKDDKIFQVIDLVKDIGII